jgi:hypothetical protein
MLLRYPTKEKGKTWRRKGSRKERKKIKGTITATLTCQSSNLELFTPYYISLPFKLQQH